MYICVYVRKFNLAPALLIVFLYVMIDISVLVASIYAKSNSILVFSTEETHFQERLLEAGYKKNILEPSGTSIWPSFILGDTLRIVFQNLLLESNEEILQCSERVWRLLVQVSYLTRMLDMHKILDF